MRHISLLLVLLLLAALLLAGCTDNDPEQTQTPAQSTNSVAVPSENVPPDTQSGMNATAEPAATVPVPTELETQDSVVIDVTGQPVIGG